MTVNVPDEESTTRNLIPRNLVRNWMRDSVERLYALQPQTAYATAADGGVPARDLLAAMPEVGWEKVTRDFFLTAEERARVLLIPQRAHPLLVVGEDGPVRGAVLFFADTASPFVLTCL
jgi:hypothetical protein